MSGEMAGAELNLGVMGIMFSLGGLCYMIPLGLGGEPFSSCYIWLYFQFQNWEDCRIVAAWSAPHPKPLILLLSMLPLFASMRIVREVQETIQPYNAT